MSLFGCQLAPVLLADDDGDDLSLAAAALQRAHVAHPLRCVGDGEKLLAYLDSCASNEPDCLPALILLDLNMPRMGGREALSAIKADRRLRHIPVVIWTTSAAREDVAAARAAGCDDYITKPDSFERMIAVMHALDRRWLAGNEDGA